jgi:phosphoenolpyruvate-protein phosphotransferase (PTS system enzyme I)
VKTFNQIYKESENKIAGIAAAPGINIARAYLFTKEKLYVNEGNIVDVNEAINSLNEAVDKGKKELRKIFELAKETMNETRAAIFEAQMMILDDPILIGNIKRRIMEEKRQPEFIVNDEISMYQDMMRASNELYMKERAHDIEDIKNRIIRNLQKKRWESKIAENVIVIAESLTPSDAVLFSRMNVKGFVIDHGGLTSHAAIVSRSLNIPAVVATHNGTTRVKDGELIVVDGFHGYVTLQPTEEQLEFFKQKCQRLAELQKDLLGLKDKPAVTLDNKEITLSANVDVSGEVHIVITNDGKGIGLYRTEQLIDEFNDIPSEFEQAKVYSALASRIYPDCLTIRAFDIGGDKVKILDFTEPNPFLGMRGIRVLLDNQGLFKSQIRAVLRSSESKNIQFMLPMITTIEEITESKRIIEQCKKELTDNNVTFDKDIKIGIMIEVPSAAVMAYDFARLVDFVSIGTNDLIQYMLAVDRGNDLISDLYQEFNPALLRTLSHIVKESKRAGKPVSICGEMAADTLAMPLLIGIGLDHLSISPATIPYAKKIVREIHYAHCCKLAEDCLTYTIQEEVVDRIEKFFVEHSISRTRNII